MVEVKFLKSYIASRGHGYAGAKGAVKKYRMCDELKELIDNGVVELVREAPATKRKKATGRKGAEQA